MLIECYILFHYKSSYDFGAWGYCSVSLLHVFNSREKLTYSHQTASHNNEDSLKNSLRFQIFVFPPELKMNLFIDNTFITSWGATRSLKTKSS